MESVWDKVPLSPELRSLEKPRCHERSGGLPLLYLQPTEGEAAVPPPQPQKAHSTSASAPKQTEENGKKHKGPQRLREPGM